MPAAMIQAANLRGQVKMMTRHSTAIGFAAALALTAPAAQRSAAAQSADTDAGASVRPVVTVRLFAAPGVNMMSDWRDGMDALSDLAKAHGLQPHAQCCISKSWGATALVHLTTRFAAGVTVEALRDTRQFRVTDRLDAFGLRSDGEFAFENHAEVRANQATVSFYPSRENHLHVDVAGGFATGHTELSTPGSAAHARLHAPMFSVAVGTEARFWYVDAGWRFLRMRATDQSASDFQMTDARDVFPDTNAVEEFVRGRDTDLTGAWARIGIALHFGRR